MPQSLVRNYMHIVFSTKHRQAFITPDVEDEIFCYLGGTCRELFCRPILVGGHYDHVHILCLLSQKIALMKLIEKVKAHSSGWIKTKGEDLDGFYWQNGYGAFSVGSKEVEAVMNYIANQKSHHEKITYQDEYRAFMKRYQMEYDERYVWE
ncbi:MAG: IS200/IS605 family transposase [Bacteroidales bacterium]